jgi:hypothetical protein
MEEEGGRERRVLKFYSDDADTIIERISASGSGSMEEEGQKGEEWLVSGRIRRIGTRQS